MKKSFLRNILCLLVLVCLALSVSATEYMSDYLSDSAGYLTDEQAQTLDSALEQASKELMVYIRIATEKTMSGSSPEETAGDYYDYFNDTGDGYLPGILLYVCRDDYTYYVTASDNVFNDEMISTLEDSFVPYLSDDDYLGAFNAYLETARELIVEYHGSSPNFPDDPYSDSDTVTDTIPNSAFVYDYAGYLTDEQTETLETELSQAADALTAYIRIVTEDEMSEYSKEMAAKTYYDALNDTGSGELPGILLYVCRSERVYYLEASDNVFNDEMITALEDKFVPYMRDDNYFEAFEAYLDEAVIQIKKYHGDTPHFPVDPYPNGNGGENYGAIDYPSEEFHASDIVYLLFNPVVFVVVIVVPLLIALFLTHLKVKQMNTAVKKTTADSFVKRESLNLTESRDIFLYSTVVCKPKPKDPPENHSSGGSSGFSGGGGSSGRVGHGGSF